MSHDIADECTSAEALVIAGGVKGQLAEQRAFLGDYTDMVPDDEKADGAVLVSQPEADVAEPAEIAQGDSTKAVDFILANSEMGR